MGGAPRLRVDAEILIDDVTGTATGLLTSRHRQAPGSQLTLTGGAGGVLAQTLRHEVSGSDVNLVQSMVTNTSGTGVSRLQLTANGGTGLVQLEAAPFSGCAPGQEIWLQNRVSGQAPLIVETDSDVTVTYGFNNPSHARVKNNIRDADLDELQAIFDRATPQRYDRTDCDQRDRLGFLARDFEGPQEGRRGAAHPGLHQAHGGAVGRGEAPSGEGGGAGGPEEAEGEGRATTRALTATAISRHSSPTRQTGRGTQGVLCQTRVGFLYE